MRHTINRQHIPGMLLVLIGIAFVFAQWAYQSPRTAAFTLDAPRLMLPIAGLYGQEQFADNGDIFRWTNGSGEVALPNPGGATIVHLTLAGGPRDIVPVDIHSANNTLSFLVGPERRTYTLLQPPVPAERLALTITSPTVREANRDLGVMVGDVRIAGGGMAPAQLLLGMVVATTGGYVLLRQAGWNTLPTAGVLMVAQASIIFWQALAAWRYSLCTPLLLLAGGASLAAVTLERLWPSQTPATPHPRTRWSTRDGLIILGLLLAALYVRIPWINAPDPVGDLELAARRMWLLYDQGLAGAYLYGGDYVPLRLYLLLGLGQLVRPLGGDFFAPLPDITLLLIKLPGLLADLGTVALLYIWSRRWCSRRLAAMIAALYTLAPPVWMNVAWWGQVDTLLMLPLLGMVVLLDYSRGRWSWICWASALLIKPQAIVFAPLLYITTVRRHGCTGIVQGGALATGLIAVACTPLVLAGQGPGLLEAYVGSVGRFPHLTSGAYNLWYLVTLGNGGHDSRLLLDFVSLRMVGILLLAGVALLVCVALFRRSDGPMRAQGAAVLALAFFVLPTQVHERYLFLTLAFLALWIASDERIVVPFIVLVITATLNILGTLDGFLPIAHAMIASSPLPFVCAVVNLLVLFWLIRRLLLASHMAPQAQIVNERISIDDPTSRTRTLLHSIHKD